MLVKDRMTAQPLVVATPDTPVTEAQRLMQDNNLRHLPVVVEQDGLVGLLTRETMLQAVPWSAASLSALETQYVLSKIKVSKVMIEDVITTTEDVPVEEAARVMVDRKVGCLPVLRDGALAGIITDIDLLATTMEMLGARRPGLRLAVMVPYRVGEIARLSSAIAEVGGNVTAFGTWEGESDPGTGVPEGFGMVFRVEEVSKERLIDAVGDLGDVKLLDVREMST
ncbi:MAG: Inosine-5'-monophosphate dehydrogenase [Anaerolineales bacterium]|nr:Inosine-5'-monophosphate dehydrogenase [Anaerolineales bacterium]